MPTTLGAAPDSITAKTRNRVPTLSKARPTRFGSTKPNQRQKPPSDAHELRNPGACGDGFGGLLVGREVVEPVEDGDGGVGDNRCEGGEQVGGQEGGGAVSAEEQRARGDRAEALEGAVVEGADEPVLGQVRLEEWLHPPPTLLSDREPEDEFDVPEWHAGEEGGREAAVPDHVGEGAPSVAGGEPLAVGRQPSERDRAAA